MIIQWNCARLRYDEKVMKKIDSTVVFIVATAWQCFYFCSPAIRGKRLPRGNRSPFTKILYENKDGKDAPAQV
jgi:hypothetical protein